MRAILLLACIVGSAWSADIIDPSTCTAYPCLIFNDEFDTFDLTAWEHEITLGGGGNWEFQGYVNNRSITYTHDSTLFIKPQLTADWQSEEFLTTGTWSLWGAGRWNDHCTGNAWYGCERVGASGFLNPVMSGRLRSLPFFGFRYGRIEVRAKMPTGDWIWPAVWMLPQYVEYGGWPASGEIDIIESRGNLDYGDIGVGYAASTMHWGPDYFNNRFDLTTVDYQPASGGTFGDDFHTWRVDWTEDTITFFVDDEEKMSIDPDTSFWDFGGLDASGYENPWRYGTKMSPFDKPFSIILNVAIGGTNGYFPDGIDPDKPWTNADSNGPQNFWNGRDLWLPTWEHGEGKISEEAAMQIDFVKVYKLSDN